MIGNDQPLFPRGVAAGDGFADRDLVDPATRAGQFQEVGAADRRDAEALLVFQRNDAFRGQTIERLAHGAGADAVAGAQRVDRQPVARL